MTIRILVTGSRSITPTGIMIVEHALGTITRKALLDGENVIVVQGECPQGGVDAVARRWAERTAGVTSEGHPAPWATYGRSAGPWRNARMVALGADLCLAFPAPGSRGTWDCLRKAADAGIIGRVYPLPAERYAAS